ncbi:monodehydroascorbate reductase [Dunaliella salina]|uniref:monodehydroascorbate reductase (NADH) n=1 Tax=Dunaliella salina TaxID=3046 RepID=A0ABQ7G7D5_DUNSA|nr:monodehydroascorbate reductase [Dunaliella salina]|eukprot:KAF5830518.1 monodehydroascorbate reductase [Dunaliella salina]
MLLRPIPIQSAVHRFDTRVFNARPWEWRKPVAASRRLVAAMATEHYANVTIGGGNAAGYVAKEFVAQGLGRGELAIISDEGVCAYERPALSKAYLAGEGAARLPGFHTSVGGGGERQTPEWYAEKGITYKLATKVEKVDAKTKSLSTASGNTITYDKLIYAAGSRPVYLSEFKVPGSDLQGLHYLRNTADADKLVQDIQAAKASGGKAVLVGGGYIAMEVASQLANNGVPSTIVCPEPYLLSRLFTPKIAEFYEKFYASKGVHIMKHAKATAFEGSGKVQQVVVSTKDGEQKLDASLVIVGVGARPNVELLDGQVEMVPKPVGGIKEHVTNARQTATQAVRAIKGKTTEPYDYLPFFYSRVFNLSWQFWGTNENAEVAHFGDFAAGKFGAYFISNGKVVGVFLESASPEEQSAAQKVAREQPAANLAELESKGISFATSRM